MPIEDASVDLRATVDPSDKWGLEGPGAAFQEVTIDLDVKSSAPREQVQKLVAHAHRACHAEHSLASPVPVTSRDTLNGEPLGA